MNRIPPPTFDDGASLHALANNPDVGSYPNLLPVLTAIQAGYAQYADVSGNAHFVAPVPLDEAQEDFLRGHYASPPLDLIHIDGTPRLSDVWIDAQWHVGSCVAQARTCCFCGFLFEFSAGVQVQ
jgi:hypothetical protein